jgi:UDP-N-acetylglucosamine--N-acetylmuramyl-(pentapeptide) pyrophosphoryl-undecaprenol N-acetylglucosamine transferase
VLITGGSQGSKTLNRAALEAWPLFRESGSAARFVHQTGESAWAECERAFRDSGLDGEVVRFIDDMPRAFAAADVIVCRSGAGAVAEVAAAGKASILVPFPFAADDHQLRNAQVLERAGGARMALDSEFDGRRLYREVSDLAGNREELERLGKEVRKFARPGAARRAADVLEELARSA